MFKKLRKEITATRRMLQDLATRSNPPLGKGGKARLVYIDLGLHVDGEQLRAVANWFADQPGFRAYGFEANPAHFGKVSAIPWSASVSLVNMAVVGPAHQGEEIEFYTDPTGKGLGDSIFKEKSREAVPETIRVRCTTLSRFFLKENIDPKKDVVLIRMNIEGAELQVLEDLIAHNLVPLIDGYYGSWSDCAKLSDDYGYRLEKMKSKHEIVHIQFNRTEFKGALSWLRLALVKRQMQDRVQQAMR